MKHNTDRSWTLETVLDKPHEDHDPDGDGEMINNCCIEIKEHHESYHDGDMVPHIYIPYESIDSVVLELLKAKKSFKKWVE